LGQPLGTRTKLLGIEIYQQLVVGGIKESDAKEWAKAIAGVFGACKKAVADKPLADLEIEQLVHVSPAEHQALNALAETLIAEHRAPEKDDLHLLRANEQAVDIALFGRMLASSPAFNIEAACQVAHAISVHPVVIEDDYFTAVDDLNKNLEDTGAAHIGETRFAAGLFYAYVCINRELLIKNLDGNRGLADKAIRALTEAAVKVAPEGKQNSFASRAYASYVLAEKGDQQPRSLSVAYLKPITHGENKDYCADAIKALAQQKDSFDEVYGNCADARYEVNVTERQGTLAGLLDFVA
jgi:CRISPR system Cascade subunit CasC